jgi:hypothetical protein
MLKGIVLSVAALISSTPALAGKLVAKPVQIDGQSIRYDHGRATIEDDMAIAGVRVLPIEGQMHGGYQFKVAVFNKGTSTFNFGSENVSVVHLNGPAVPCWSKDDLAKKAKKKAFWNQVAIAALTGMAAAAQNNNTNITTYGPRGAIYRTVIERPGLSDGQIATIAAGGAGVALTQLHLEKTLAMLNDEVAQTTTLDPQSGYGGIVVAQKLKKAKAGDEITLRVMVGEEAHLFRFRLEKA